MSQQQLNTARKLALETTYDGQVIGHDQWGNPAMWVKYTPKTIQVRVRRGTVLTVRTKENGKGVN